MDSSITRRDFLGATLLGAGTALLDGLTPAQIPAPREVLRSAPFGRIAFANTDLAGAMDHRYSILEAHRAVGQIVDQVITS